MKSVDKISQFEDSDIILTIKPSFLIFFVIFQYAGLTCKPEIKFCLFCLFLWFDKNIFVQRWISQRPEER